MLARGRFISIMVSSLLAATTVNAAVPSPPNSVVEPVLVGNSNGALIGDGFRVTVRDINNTPVPGATVDLVFAGTVRPYTAQVPPATSGCPAAPVIRKVADAAGNVMFQARFGGYVNAPAIQVRADGVLLSQVQARSTDIDVDGTTAVGDFNLFRINFLFNPPATETDYNEDGMTLVGDFDIFRKVFLNEVPGTLCP